MSRRLAGNSTPEFWAASEMKAMTGVQDQWAAGSSYEDFMGRWSRRLAPEFISWLRVSRGIFTSSSGAIDSPESRHTLTRYRVHLGI